jgi:hypothetical protein
MRGIMVVCQFTRNFLGPFWNLVSCLPYSWCPGLAIGCEGHRTATKPVPAVTSAGTSGPWESVLDQDWEAKKLGFAHCAGIVTQGGPLKIRILYTTRTNSVLPLHQVRGEQGQRCSKALARTPGKLLHSLHFHSYDFNIHQSLVTLVTLSFTFLYTVALLRPTSASSSNKTLPSGRASRSRSFSLVWRKSASSA